jgi:transcriptional regulator with XRE-family HTH domain
MTNKNVEFSEKLKKKMDEKRITQSVLARRLGVTSAAIWNWEQGNSFPREMALSRLAKVLGVEVAWLRGTEPTDVQSPNEPELDTEASLVDEINRLKEKIAEANGIDIDDVKIKIELVV